MQTLTRLALLLSLSTFALGDAAARSPRAELRRLIALTQALVTQATAEANRASAQLSQLVAQAGQLPGAAAGHLRFGAREDDPGRRFLGCANGQGFNIGTAYQQVFADALTAGGAGSIASRTRLAVQARDRALEVVARRSDLLRRLQAALARCGCSRGAR